MATASFGEWIRERRKARDLTQAGLAERAGVAVVTIRKIESDERRPSRAMALRLAEILEIPAPERERFATAARSWMSPLRLASPEDAPATTSTVPAPLHALIGREALLSEVCNLMAIAGGGARLVTLTGPPGVGKTRLALEVARFSEREHDVGTLVIDLVSADGASAMRERVAAAVPLHGTTPGDRFERAKHVLRRAPTLLVLDHLDHVSDASVVVTELLSACAELTCLVTSRARLDAYGEFEVAVPPLALPPGAVAGMEALRGFAATRLFLDRCRASGRSIEDADADAVARICARVDGLPLAIELAARRARTSRLDELAEELEKGLARLDAGARHADARHRTMAAAVEWSTSRLDDTTRRLLGSLSTVATSFDTSDVAVLSGLGRAVGGALAELVDRGLVLREGDRYRVLRPIADVVRHDAVIRGEHSAARERWSTWVGALLEREPTSLLGDGAPGGEPIAMVYGDVRQWLTERATDEPARLAAAVRKLGAFWVRRADWAEAELWAEAAHRRASDELGRADAALVLAMALSSRGARARATELLEQALGTGEAQSDEALVADATGLLGMLCALSGDMARASALLARSLAAYETISLRAGEAFAQIRLGRLAAMRGELETFRAHNEAALAIYRATGHGWGAGNALANLAEADLLSHQGDAALAHALAATRALIEVDAQWLACSALALCACALLAMDRDVEAARVVGLVDGWLADLGAPAVHMLWSSRFEAAREGARTRLDAAFAAEIEVGASSPRDADALTRLVGGVPSCRG